MPFTDQAGASGFRRNTSPEFVFMVEFIYCLVYLLVEDIFNVFNVLKM